MAGVLASKHGAYGPPTHLAGPNKKKMANTISPLQIRPVTNRHYRGPMSPRHRAASLQSVAQDQTPRIRVPSICPRVKRREKQTHCIPLHLSHKTNSSPTPRKPPSLLHLGLFFLPLSRRRRRRNPNPSRPRPPCRTRRAPRCSSSSTTACA
jgi:hypothetical protein